jgi:hypothetical protein
VRGELTYAIEYARHLEASHFDTRGRRKVKIRGELPLESQKLPQAGPKNFLGDETKARRQK